MTLPRRRLWRLFFWIAVIAILVELLGLTSTFVEARRRRVGEAAFPRRPGKLHGMKVSVGNEKRHYR